MKRIFVFTITLWWCFLTILAQQLSITVYQPSYDNLPEEARASLENKLEQILISNNVVSGQSDRFVFSAKMTVAQKNVIPSNPVRISEHVDVTLTIGDAIDNQVYGRQIISVAGIGNTETMAIIQAFQHISTKNDQICKLISSAKVQIEDYYTNHCQNVLDNAERMQISGNTADAIAHLLSVPESCPECYKKAQEMAKELYQTKIDDESVLLYKKAQTEWAIRHDYQHAQKAMEYLLQINPHSKTVGQADKLFQEIEHTLRKNEQSIAAHQKETEQREWELRVQQYNDNVALRKQRIDMFQAIGVAIGQGLPQTVTKVVKTW